MKWTLLVTALCACTTLGPMPAISGTTPIPIGRTSVEAQIGAVPGYYLSSAAKENPDGAPVGQMAVIVELGPSTHLPGVLVGGRYVGEGEEGGHLEPLLGYRNFLDAQERFAVAFVASAGHGEGEADGASVEATRVGLDATFDARVTPRHKWFEIHVTAVASVSGVWASGAYCTDADGRYGVMCPDPPAIPMTTEVSGEGFYPAGGIGVAADTARHLAGPFHGARVAFQVAAGAMPRVEGDEQKSAAAYGSLGLSLTVGFGASE